MKNVKFILAFLIAWGLCFASAITAQVESRNGYQLPPRGPVKVLIVFAELVGPCAGSPVSNWPTGTAAPPNANLYLDHVVNANPTTFLSRYYSDMSLGEHQLIGDYYPYTVQVPCSMFSGGYDGPRDAIEVLNNEWQPALDGNYYTFNGINLADFDEYQYLSSGFPKPQGNPDGNIDATVVLWRNHPTFSCGSGLGVGNTINETLLNWNVKLYGSWDFCPNKLNTGYDGLFVAEYFHSLYGHNNFHTGGGADEGTYMFSETSSFSTTAQSSSSSNVVCGWDRNFLDWRGSRQYRISAQNQSGQEVPSDISVASHPNTSFFVLNDFVTVGDAVRIKLPHFDWQTNGDKKNQYLWLENHQQVNEFDESKSAASCGDWGPGLHAYIQTGKDLITGDVYGGSYAEPNDLNDWLFPLPAEGRWDFFYSNGDENQSWATCQWNNKSLPYSIKFPDGSSLPNPFTGYSDLYGYIDSNNDGALFSGDDYQARYQKWLGTPNVGSPPAPTLPRWGDNLDPFTSTGQKISISTNPSPTPIYTQRESASSPSNYDNRSIHLNNISVTIVDDDYYNVGNSGPKAMLICVKFDDKFVENDVRWCGNVVLRNDPMDPANRQMQINVVPNKCITLDKGLSPTKKTEVSPGSGDFTDDSFLHLLDGTIMTLQSGAKLKVINGSTFHVQSGATLIIGPNAKVEVDGSSIICIEAGANVIFQSSTSKIVIDGKPYSWDYDLVNVTLSNSSLNYYALNNITTSGFSPGVKMPSSGNVLLEARNTILMKPKTIITPGSGQLFRARIKDPYDCSNVENYNESLPPDVPGTAGGHFDNHVHDTEGGELGDKDAPFQTLDGLTLFPNPAQDVVYVQYEDALDIPVDVLVYDAVGKLMYKKQFNSDLGAMAIHTREWPSGMYLLQIARGDDIQTKRLVVERL